VDNKILYNYDDSMEITTILKDGPVLAKIYTDTCPVCGLVDKKIQEIRALREDIRIINIDGAKCSKIINWLNVRTVPKLFIMFTDGTFDHFIEYNENLITSSIEDIIKFYDELGDKEEL
jgi:hypothetical protein